MKDIMAGVDLHSNNLMLALVDKEGRRVMHQKLACDLKGIEQALAPYRKRIDTIAVESTFNWYWLIDLSNPEGRDRIHSAEAFGPESRLRD